MTETPLGTSLPDALALVAGRAPHHQMRLESFDQENGLLRVSIAGQESVGAIPVDLLGTSWADLSEDQRVEKVDFLLHAFRIRHRMESQPAAARKEIEGLLRPMLFLTDMLQEQEKPLVYRELLPPVYSVVLGLQLDGLTIPLSASAFKRWDSQPDVPFVRARENLKGDSFRREDGDEGLIWFGGNNAGATLLDPEHWFDIPDRGLLVRPLCPDLLMLLPVYPWTSPTMISLMFQVQLPAPDPPPAEEEMFAPIWCSPAGVLEAPSGVARTPCGVKFHVPGPEAMRAIYRLP